MDWSTPGFPVRDQLLRFTQTHVHWVGDAIQPSHPLSSLSPPAFNLSQHQDLLNESVLHIRWSKYWSFNFNISPSNEGLPMVSSRFEIMSSSGGTRCHHDNTGLEEKTKKVCHLQFYFLLLLPRLLTLSCFCIKGFSHLSKNYKKQNRNKVWRLCVCMCIVWNKVHCHWHLSVCHMHTFKSHRLC